MSEPHPTTSATAPRWKRSQSLELVHRLNEQCLELLSSVTVAEADADCPWLFANRELWARLGHEARMRAARLPFVILDLHFADEAWWRRVIDTPKSAVREPDITNGLPSKLSERLVQETLMCAWQMARSDSMAAQMSFAMLPHVAETIAALMPGEVRDIAFQWQGEIRVRWANNCYFWRDLLEAAESEDRAKLAELHLHAKLLALGPLICKRSGATLVSR